MVQNNKLFFILSICMCLIVIASNYLVQFPINKYGLEEILTYGAFSYPITFLITDMANRTYGKTKARKIVILGFIIGIFYIQIFYKLILNKKWYIAPLISSTSASIIDTFLFFSIAFYMTGIPWLTLALGDLIVKLLISLAMLIPFRVFINYFKEISYYELEKRS